MKPLLKSALAYLLPNSLRRGLFRGRFWILQELARNPESAYSLDAYDRHRCIFFHIPKTAGISVARALFGDRGAGHLDVEEAKLLFGGWAFRRYFKFAFVRNPYDRLVSAYTYLRSGAIGGRMSPWIQRHILPFPTFPEFVRDGLSRTAVATDLHFRPQHTFICDRRLRPQVDFLGRFERLEEDFSVVAERLGLPAELPRRNVSRRREDFRSYYDEATRDRARHFYRVDLELFGYEFEPERDLAP